MNLQQAFETIYNSEVDRSQLREFLCTIDHVEEAREFIDYMDSEAQEAYEHEKHVQQLFNER